MDTCSITNTTIRVELNKKSQIYTSTRKILCTKTCSYKHFYSSRKLKIAYVFLETAIKRQIKRFQTPSIICLCLIVNYIPSFAWHAFHRKEITTAVWLFFMATWSALGEMDESPTSDSETVQAKCCLDTVEWTEIDAHVNAFNSSITYTILSYIDHNLFRYILFSLNYRRNPFLMYYLIFCSMMSML